MLGSSSAYSSPNASVSPTLYRSAKELILASSSAEIHPFGFRSALNC